MKNAKIIGIVFAVAIEIASIIAIFIALKLGYEFITLEYPLVWKCIGAFSGSYIASKLVRHNHHRRLEQLELAKLYSSQEEGEVRRKLGIASSAAFVREQLILLVAGCFIGALAGIHAAQILAAWLVTAKIFTILVDKFIDEKSSSDSRLAHW